MKNVRNKRFLSLFLTFAILCSLTPAIHADEVVMAEQIDESVDELQEAPAEVPEVPEVTVEEAAPAEAGSTGDENPDSEAAPAEETQQTEVSETETDVIAEGTPEAAETEGTETTEQAEVPEQTETEPSEEEAQSAEEETEASEEGEEAAAADTRLIVTFVSAQAVTLTVSDDFGDIEPAAEEEVAALLAARAGTDAATAEETDEVTQEAAAKEIQYKVSYILNEGIYYYTAAAEGYCPIENVAVKVSEESGDMTIQLALEEKRLPFGFNGMPEGYTLTEDQLAAKQALIENDVVGTLAGLQEGVDYAAGEVFFLADSEEYARTVAEAYNAELTSYQYGVAILNLSSATVQEAVGVAANPEYDMPVVEPNYIQEVDPLIPGQREFAQDYSLMGGEEVPGLQSWRDWFDSTSNPDPYLADPTSYIYQYMHDVVNTYEAWGVASGAGVKVAVIDTGVSSHEDLSDVTYLDPNGYGQSDDEGHGTHVAGIIAADSENGLGGAGIAPDATILAVRVADSSGNMSEAAIIKGINAAVNNGAWIMNMSLGSPVYSYSLERALRTAVNNGCTPVISMGNDGTNLKCYPVAYNIPGLIAVGSCTESKARSVFSNYGAWEDILAPGSAIVSTTPGNNYAIYDGTSMAAPVVSGVCALYMSAYGHVSPTEMEKTIKKAATNKVIDASKLFVKDKTVPVIVDANGYVIGSNSMIPYGSTIYVAYQSANGMGDAVALYTTDGKAPSIKDGHAVNGTVSTDGAITITSGNGFYVGQKKTVRAAFVSGMGVLSKITKATFTVAYSFSDSVSVVNLPSSGGLVAGQAYTLKAEVIPAEADQAVTWTVDPGDCAGVIIDPVSGELSSTAEDEGVVVVTATTSDGVSCNVEIEVGRLTPASSLHLSSDSCVLGYSTVNPQSRQMEVKAYDSDGQEIPAAVQWFSSNPNVVAVDNEGNISAVSKGKAVITCRAEGESGAEASCNVSVTQLVESIEIKGPDCAAPGKKTGYTVSVLPKNADLKDVEWSVSGADGVSISQNGQLTVPSSIETGVVTVTATAKDGGDASASVGDIQIRPNVSYVVVTINDSSFGGGDGVASYAKSGSVKQLTLYSAENDYWINPQVSSGLIEDSDGNLLGYQKTNKSWHNSWVQLRKVTDYYTSVSWTSNKPAVATVDSTGKVTAVKAGTAVITCKALDGSNKKCSVTVRVINPASGVTVVSSSKATASDTFKLLGVGKSVSNKAVLGDAFGTPTIKKVKWSYTVKVYKNDSSGTEQTWLENYVLSNKLINMNASGTVSAKNNNALKRYATDYSIQVTVTATTTDGTGLSGSVTYQVKPIHTKLALYANGRYWNSVTWNTTFGYYYDFEVYSAISNDYWPAWDFTLTSSNPNVAGAYFVYDDDGNQYVRVMTNNEGKKGSAKITIKATDGSNKTCSINVKVK